MKNKKLAFLSVLFSCVMLVLIGCSGCKSDVDNTIPLKYDDQIKEDGSYNENLFYRNDLNQIKGADPDIIYISDENSTEYGYYYVYITEDGMWVKGFNAYRSKDLSHWECVSAEKGFPAYMPSETAFGYSDNWAPEVIYDEKDGKYYLFSSCSSWNGKTGRRIILSVADEPYGPFKACTNGNLSDGTPLFDEEKLEVEINRVLHGEGRDTDDNPGEYIDPSPFIAADGTKYLYFVCDAGHNPINSTCVWGIKMNEWWDPDYSSVAHLTENLYYTVTDRSEGNRNSEEVSAGTMYINEGPHMLEIKKDDGTYQYNLTFSINGYSTSRYQVWQAIADSPLGAFRKLKKEEGGSVLSNQGGYWDCVSGPGHHSFVKANDEIFIAYHQINNREYMTKQRYIAFDRVGITEKGKGEKVIYVNGPTWALQPVASSGSEYKNIVSEASVTADTGENINALSDGLLSIYDDIDYVKEYSAKNKATITIKFDDYRPVTGIMIYNSKTFEKTFVNISRIEFDFKDESKNYEYTASINNLAFDWSRYKDPYQQIMRPGGSSVALFNEMLVKEIRITIDSKSSREAANTNAIKKWDGDEPLMIQETEGYYIDQEEVSVSEIVVLGK